MAGNPLGALASASLTPGASPRRSLQLASGNTRTRRSHGAFPLGELIASIYSSRRERNSHVILAVGRDALRLDVSMSPTQARAMSQALAVAARAAEAKGEVSVIDAEGGAA